MSADSFRMELEALINRHSMENGGCTPDFILAKFLAKCLVNFDETVVARDAWYGVRATGISMQPIRDGEAQLIEQIPAPVMGGGGAGAGGLNVGQPIGYVGGAGGNAGGAFDALSATRSIVTPLRDDEERDWRTFALAKTREGSVWDRASVQRLFATIDTHRKRWQDYERDFILPCFRWARELGLDLEQMVLANPGRNCVELLVSALRERVSGALIAEVDDDRPAGGV